MTQTDVLEVLQTQTGRSWKHELQAWVHGTEDLPVLRLLAAHGVQSAVDQPAPAQAFGLRVQESHSVLIKQVLRGGPGERAGMMAGDEWYGIEMLDTPDAGWRISKLEELNMYLPKGTAYITALVARDRQLLRLPLTIPNAQDAVSNYQLSIQDSALVERWLRA